MNEYKRELEEQLKQINKTLIAFGSNLELVIIGGAAFILKDLVPRATEDFDFINKANQDVIKIINGVGFDVNDRAKIFDYQFGIDWDKDIHPLVKLSNLTINTLSTERLMVSRLFSSRRHEDFESSYERGKINQKKFEDVLIEVFPDGISLSERSFYENAYMVKEMYEKKGWDYENSNIKHLCENKTSKLL